MSQTPRLEEVLEAGINDRMRNFYTALPGEIVNYSPVNQRADIRIKVMNAEEDSTGKKYWLLPIIRQVLVMFPGGTAPNGDKYRLTYPVAVGDPVLYIVATLPLTEWMGRGYANLEIDPVAYNNLCHGFAIPGIHTSTGNPGEAPVDAMVLHGETVKVGGPTGTQPTFMATTFLTVFEDLLTAIKAGLIAAGNTQVGGAAIGTAFQTAIDAFDAAIDAAKTQNAQVK